MIETNRTDSADNIMTPAQNNDHIPISENEMSWIEGVNTSKKAIIDESL